MSLHEKTWKLCNLKAHVMKETQERCSKIWLKPGQQGESRGSTKAGKAVRLEAKVAMKELEKVVGNALASKHWKMHFED